MILGKFWSAFRAQINKIANLFWEADPIAQMQYEYDSSVEQLKDGRQGLETYRALVERVSRQVASGRDHVQKLEAQTKAYLKAGQRDAAAKFALELQKAKKDLAANEQQLAMHEESYGNNLKKIQHATKKLGEVRDKIQKYDAELKMSSAEAEVAAAGTIFQPGCDHRLRSNRAGDPGQDRQEPREDPGGGRPFAGRHRVHSSRREDGEGNGRRRACRSLKPNWDCVRRKRPSLPTLPRTWAPPWLTRSYPNNPQLDRRLQTI